MTGQAPELPRHIRLLLPLLRSRPGGVRSRAIARVPEPVIKTRFQWFTGGEGGIRTHGTVSRTQHFQCCQLSRSCTSPDQLRATVSVAGQVRSHGSRLYPNQDYGLRTHDSMAERVGFEPTVPLRVQRFSRPPDSTTLAPLRYYSIPRLLRKKDCIIDLHSLSRTPSSMITR